MYIHKLRKGSSGRHSFKPLAKKVASNNKRIIGSGLTEQVYENGRLGKATDSLKNLKISKPRIPKKYITFD
jgi:hypothetical protein